jgi:hypothetical protein
VIVSDKLISLLLTQISENAHLTAVFDELFAADGSELYMRPAADYVQLEQSITFSTLVESAMRRGEVAIGYRRMDDVEDGDGGGSGLGVYVNPAKSKSIVLSESDRVVVLAED